MKSITVSRNDKRKLKEIFSEAGFDKGDVDIKMNHLEGTITYSQPDPTKKKRKQAIVSAGACH